MKRTLITLAAGIACMAAFAQSVNVKWPLSDKDNIAACEITGEESLKGFITPNCTKGRQIAELGTMTGSNADAGYTPVTYEPAFTTFTPSTKVTAKTTGHYVRLYVTPASGHTFYPKRISFDAAKVGTDGGNFDVYYKVGNAGDDQTLAQAVKKLL